MPISRSAVSGASEPCATFSSIVEAKSPRMVPGAASLGFVAPIILRHSKITFSHLDDHRYDRAAGDKRDKPLKKRFTLVLAVVPFGGFTRDLHEFHADDTKAFGLEPPDHFADQTAFDAVGFYHCVGEFCSHNESAYHTLQRLSLRLQLGR